MFPSKWGKKKCALIAFGNDDNKRMQHTYTDFVFGEVQFFAKNKKPN